MEVTDFSENVKLPWMCFTTNEFFFLNWIYSLPESEMQFQEYIVKYQKTERNLGFNLDFYEFVSLHAQCSVCFDCVL